MTDDETMRSAELFESLAGDYTLIVVEHDMDFVARIADRVTVLHEGHVWRGLDAARAGRTSRSSKCSSGASDEFNRDRSKSRS
jgi:urea transport system ATP-binding protein